MMTLETDREATVRECPLCPTWFECAHFGDECVRLSAPEPYDAHLGTCGRHSRQEGSWVVGGPMALKAEPVSGFCSGWDGRFGPTKEAIYFNTEAEARAEFERRVALMIGREEAE